MEKNIQIGLLYEFYSNLLTEKQSYIIDSYYNNDLSLAEIADNIKITRQGVQKQIKDSERILLNYEDKLHLLENHLNNKNIIVNIIKIIEKYDIKEKDDIISNLNKLN